MSDHYGDRRAAMRKQARRRRRNALATTVLVTAGAAVAVVGLAALMAALGAVGVFLGWNLGVYGFAHAVHTGVRHVSFWTAFGACFAIGALRRLLTSPITFKFDRGAS